MVPYILKLFLFASVIRGNGIMELWGIGAAAKGNLFILCFPVKGKQTHYSIFPVFQHSSINIINCY